MKPTQLFSVLIFSGSFLFLADLVQAQDDIEKSPRPYLGVKLDPNPLPELLVKHLNLDSDRGLLIKNIQRDSPADKAGLENASRAAARAAAAQSESLLRTRNRPDIAARPADLFDSFV